MIEKDIGFVLRRYNFRETSLIVHFYTLRSGKITGILKGFYTGKKEFASSLDVFTLNEIIFYPKKRSLWLISGVDLVGDYPFLRSDFSRAQIAGIFLHLVNYVMQLWDTNSSVFYLLKESIEALEYENEFQLLYIFLIKFLTLSGFKPELTCCIACHKQINDNIFFSAAQGGLLCAQCSSQRAEAQKVSPQAAASLHYIQKTEFPLLLRLRPTQQCVEEMLYIVRKFVLFHLNYDIVPKLPLKV